MRGSANVRIWAKHLSELSPAGKAKVLGK